MRPFNEIYYPGPKWYRWWDFGNGTMSDLGSHWNDLPFWALELEYPLTIEAGGPPPHPEIAPASMWAKYEYGPRGDLPPVTMTLVPGRRKTPDLERQGHSPMGQRLPLRRRKGHAPLRPTANTSSCPRRSSPTSNAPEPFIPRVKSHHIEWIEACKAGKQSSANFHYSGLLTEANHLGNVAYRVGKKLQWDPVKMTATNAPEAAPMIRCPYREGWTLG